MYITAPATVIKSESNKEPDLTRPTWFYILVYYNKESIEYVNVKVLGW